MSNAMVTQWIEMSQEAMKKMSEAQKTGFGNFSKTPTVDVSSVAEIMKSSMQAYQQATNENVAALNNLISGQATSMKLNVSADAIQQLTEIMAALTNNAIQQQTQLTTNCVKPFTTFLTKLSEVKNAEDLTGLQTAFAEDLSTTLKAGASDNAQLISSLQSAVTAWTEKTLDNTAAS